MVGFQLYVFFLCLIVFIALTAVFSFMIIYIAKQKATLIVSGLEDEKIRGRLTKKLEKRSTKAGIIIDKITTVLSVVLCAGLCVLFVITGISSCRGDEKVGASPALKVIASTSMSERYENNKYLFENDLSDQLQMFDVVVLHELPAEEDLKLYDIVVYEHISGALLIHRIIGIEEPNESHPNERHFLLQGDAVHYPDTFPVRYSQMRSIYKGERIPNVGSFVYFMQSPAGIICLILIMVSFILMPIADRFILKLEFKRVAFMVENGELDKEAINLYSKGIRNSDPVVSDGKDGGGDSE